MMGHFTSVTEMICIAAVCRAADKHTLPQRVEQSTEMMSIVDENHLPLPSEEHVHCIF